jgi:hypothetical protein
VFHELTLNEFADAFADVGAIADGLAFTIEQMAKIDKAYKAAFAKRG